MRQEGRVWRLGWGRCWGEGIYPQSYPQFRG